VEAAAEVEAAAAAEEVAEEVAAEEVAEEARAPEEAEAEPRWRSGRRRSAGVP
jgi:hypothetical protein